MHVEIHGDARAFLDAAGELLLGREAENNIVLASAYLLLDGDHPFSEPFFLASIVDRGRVAGAAIRTPPDSLHLTAMPGGAPARLVDAIAAAHPSLPSVAGPVEAGREFAEAWCRTRGGTAAVRHRWRLYVLERLEPIAHDVPGELRLAGPGDLPRLREWGPRYARDANTRVDVTAFLERMMRRQGLYLWDDGGPRCLVAMSGRTPQGIRVSAVYTPDEYRNRGYATAAVAGATSAVLARGLSFCMLVAETKDEAPNRIYRRIGFEPVQEHVMIDLTARARA